jgi:hypothetical protein
MGKARRTKPAKAGLWRWRRSPLRRRSDSVEAWVVLATWILALLGGLFAGRAAAAAMDDSLASRRAEVHPVSAVLTEEATEDSPAATYGTDSDRVWAKVRWTTADGSAHAGRARVEPPAAAGTRATVWTDRTGAPVPQPPTATEARLQADLAGVLVLLCTAALASACGWVIRRRLDRRRMAEWAAEWERVGPQWRKRMLG